MIGEFMRPSPKVRISWWSWCGFRDSRTYRRMSTRLYLGLTRSEIVGGIAGYRVVVQGYRVASLVEYAAIAAPRLVAGDVAVSQG